MDFDMDFDFGMDDIDAPILDGNDLTDLSGNGDWLNPSSMADNNLINASGNGDWLNPSSMADNNLINASDNDNWLNPNSANCSEQSSLLNGSAIDNSNDLGGVYVPPQFEPCNPMHWDPGSDIRHSSLSDETNALFRERRNDFQHSFSENETDLTFESLSASNEQNRFDDTVHSSESTQENSDNANGEDKVHFGLTHWHHYCRKCNHKWWDSDHYYSKCPECGSSEVATDGWD